MDKKIMIVFSILIVFTVFFAGCNDIFPGDDGKTTYQSHTSKISCTLTYGYWVNCTGDGRYEINYDCDTPEVLNGQVSSLTIHNNDYTENSIAGNNMISWNIDDDINKNHKLGITANIVNENYIVSDLNGGNSLTIAEISEQYPELVEQYCQPQSNKTIIYINPDSPSIKSQALTTYNDANTDNAFLIAKELFKWLKQTTTYQIHTDSNSVQDSAYTMTYKTGDCDDLSFLYISLCRAVDIPARFIRGFLVEKSNDEVIVTPHAWTEVFVGGGIGNSGWISVECAGTATIIDAEINQNFALESASHIRLFKDDGSHESLNSSLSGLSYLMYGNRDIDSEPIAYAINYEILEKKELVVDKNGMRSYQ